MDQSKASEEGKLMFFERATAPGRGETYQSASDFLQKGLYDLCETYDIAMAYRNGVQLDRTKTYFGFHTEVFLFPYPSLSSSAPYPSQLTTHPTPTAACRSR